MGGGQREGGRGRGCVCREVGGLGNVKVGGVGGTGSRLRAHEVVAEQREGGQVRGRGDMSA